MQFVNTSIHKMSPCNIKQCLTIYFISQPRLAPVSHNRNACFTFVRCSRLSNSHTSKKCPRTLSVRVSRNKSDLLSLAKIDEAKRKALLQPQIKEFPASTVSAQTCNQGMIPSFSGRAAPMCHPPDYSTPLHWNRNTYTATIRVERMARMHHPCELICITDVFWCWCCCP